MAGGPIARSTVNPALTQPAEGPVIQTHSMAGGKGDRFDLANELQLLRWGTFDEPSSTVTVHRHCLLRYDFLFRSILICEPAGQTLRATVGTCPCVLRNLQSLQDT